MTGDKKRPEALADLLKAYLKESGLEARVEQAEVIPEWPTLVGARIAAVTHPLFVTPDGTLFVAVTTHAWMNELQLMQRDLLQALNAKTNRQPIEKLRFQLLREEHR